MCTVQQHLSDSKNSNISCSQAPAQLTVISGSSNNLAMTSSARPCSNANLHHTNESMFDGQEAVSLNASNGHPVSSLGANVIPALGNAWHHCVSTRLVLEQFEDYRTITIAKSPIAAKDSADFEIGMAGLVEIHDQDE